NTIIKGNFIGTNAAGGAAVANGLRGIEINSVFANNVVIGGTYDNVTVGPIRVIGTGTLGFAGNLISGNGTAGNSTLVGNSRQGIRILATNTQVLGNYIGTDVTGTAAVGNGNLGTKGIETLDGGVLIISGLDNTIGGTAATAGNLIS